MKTLRFPRGSKLSTYLARLIARFDPFSSPSLPSRWTLESYANNAVTNICRAATGDADVMRKRAASGRAGLMMDRRLLD